MKKPAVYYRVSTTKQDIESQKIEIESFLKDRGFNPSTVPVYADVGYSGKDPNRPEFQRMIQDAFRRKIDCIIVYKLDRFSRSANTAIRLILELDDNKVGFLAINNPALCMDRDMPMRRTMLAAFAEIGQIERENIVDRIKSGLKAAKSRGVKLGPPVKLSDEVKAKIFELKNAGLSNRKIAPIMKLGSTTIDRVIKGATG